MRAGRFIILLVLMACPACDVWAPPEPTQEELDRGLIVMYPGALNTKTEMVGFYYGLRAAGVDQAIEVQPYSPPLLNFLIPTEFIEYERPWAQDEAVRIADYQQAHPESPVTLLGFSGGAMAATLVTEEMPADQYIDCVIMMSPGISPFYNLDPMLANTKEGAIVYWSPTDTAVTIATQWWGTLDGFFGAPAASAGFRSSNPKLTQVHWGPGYAVYGNHGQHTDYAGSIEWIRDFVAPWISHVESPGQVKDGETAATIRHSR